MNHFKALEILGLNQGPGSEINIGIPISEDMKTFVRKQYRKLSLQHHPDRGGSAEQFEQITQAYDCLMSGVAPPYDASRGVAPPYDATRVGVGMGVGSGQEFPPNVVQIFNQAYTSMPNHFGAGGGAFVANLRYIMDVTTTDTFHGCNKTITVKRNLPSGITSAGYTVNIAPGSYHGQEIVIPGAGNQNAVGLTTDLIIQLNEINNTDFIRDKQNLTFKVSVTLRNALLGSTLNIIHPSGKTLTVNYRLSSPTTVNILQGKGMPIYGTTNCYGDLKIEFSVLFPTSIPEYLVLDLDGVLSALDYRLSA